MAARRLRGVRPMGVAAEPVPDDEVLRAVQERGLLFELMAHPDQLQHAAERLARFKRPARIEVVDSLPRTVTGKVARGRLRSRARGAPDVLG